MRGKANVKKLHFIVIFIMLLVLMVVGFGCGQGYNPDPSPSARSITWCHPLPQGNSLRGIWGSSLSDIFVVGDYGSVAHYNGSAWSLMDSGTTESFWSVWGTGGNNVYATTDNQVYHYNGSNWQKIYEYTAIESPHLNPIWGSSASDIFVGGAGVMLHYNGTAWATMEIGTELYITAIWGTSNQKAGGQQPMMSMCSTAALRCIILMEPVGPKAALA